MLIDWFTVGAQALNFLILVWLMKRFLYKPILQAIDTREKLIAKEIADADAKKAEAQKEHEEFQHKNDEFDKQRTALLDKATGEAKAERQRLLDEARKAADALSAKRQETLKSDAHNLNLAISRRTQQEVFAIARKTLKDLATTGLEDGLVKKALHQPHQDHEIERLRPDGEPIDEHGLLPCGFGDRMVPERIREDEDHRNHEAVDGRGFDHRQTHEQRPSDGR